MTTEQNKATERRVVAEVLNRGNLKALDECITLDFIYHGPGGREIKGIADYKRFIDELRAQSPDIHVTIENILAEGNLVATRTLCTFTVIDRNNAAAPKKKVTMDGSILDRFEGKKIAETWEHYDRLGLYQQLGLIPAPPAA